MSQGARPLDPIAIGVIVLLCMSWGLNQVAIKLTLPDFPPLTQAAIRSAGALVLVLAWSAWRGVRLFARDGTLPGGMLAGALFGFEFVLVYLGLQWTTASRATIFIYTAPFFVALGGAMFLPGEKLGAWQWIGLLLSFVGVALALGVPTPAASAQALMGDLMLIGAGAAWGATTLVIRGSRLVAAPAEKTFVYQIGVSIPILAVGAWLTGESIVPAPRLEAVWWLVYQTVWVVGVTYAVWFAMVQKYSPSRLSAFTFLTPLFGVAAGHFVLGDVISPVFAGAAALVVAGLVLVNRRP